MRPRLSLLFAALAFSLAAQAHDTWFEPQATAHELALGTGALFPRLESGIDTVHLARQGCHVKGLQAPLRPLRNRADALTLAAPPQAQSCWAELAPFEIELAADKITAYLNEVRPAPAITEAWAAMQARGLPWQERYVKYARVHLLASASSQPSGMDFDALLQTQGPPPQVGQPLSLQVLRDGQPLAGFNVELRSDRTRSGLWRRTDDQGRVDFTPPLPGRWILRGVDLRLSAARPDSFDSRFLTLAFEVQPRTAAP